MVAIGTKSILGRQFHACNDEKFQILIASDTDANLQHQRIKYVHRKIVHVKLEIIEDSDQTTYTEKCNNN